MYLPKICFRSLPYDSLPVRKHAYDCTRLQKLLNNYIEFFDIDLSKFEMTYLFFLYGVEPFVQNGQDQIYSG